ncbi:MAG: D-alanyl-D-alanine carboxypeptidase family protein [Bradyrhizobium sp.]|nr:D-alanyl-D-alanine carboxypeptidase family protein [Bradyrhizobium sp.]
MNPQRSTTVAAACYPAVVIAAWAVVNLGGMGSPHINTATAADVVERLAPTLTASVELAAPPQASATVAPPTKAPHTIAASYAVPETPEVAAAAELVAMPLAAAKPVPEATSAETEPRPIVLAALTDPVEILPAEIPAPDASTADAPSQDAARTAERIELVGECLVAEACIDQFLWALYQRTPKEDTIKERERRKVTVKRKGKLVTVTRTFTKLVENDFTWKDPKAAERIGMSMIDYVIGGMDRSFKLKLFHMLYAAEAAGLQPGITSAFRDDYRQGIASGLKAASNRSYHGGSLRGGYGHGLAADIVSVNGSNRAQRWVSTEALWKWVDANGKQYGIGRPYLKFDPPHVGPIDGQEYVSRRGGAKTAAADVKKRQKQVARAKPAAAKRQAAARSPSSKPTERLAEAR